MSDPWVELAKSIGFPAIVALILLLRIEPRLRRLTRQVIALRRAYRGGRRLDDPPRRDRRADGAGGIPR